MMTGNLSQGFKYDFNEWSAENAPRTVYHWWVFANQEWPLVQIVWEQWINYCNGDQEELDDATEKKIESFMICVPEFQRSVQYVKKLTMGPEGLL